MLDTNGDQGGERLRSTVERQPTASAVFRHCEATRKQITAAAGLVVEIGTPSRDLNASSSGDGECEVSSVLRPKRKSYCDELDGWRSEDSETRRSLNLITPAAGAASNKRQRAGSKREEVAVQQPLGVLSQGELELVMSFLPASALAVLNCTCKFFTSTQTTEDVAKRKVKANEAWAGIEPGRGETWMSLLHFLTKSDSARQSERLIGLGAYHTTIIDEGTKDVYTCGRGFHGQLGNGHYENVGVPERILLVPHGSPDSAEAAEPAARATQVACGSSHNAVITSSGQLFTWGLASSGELGHGGWTPIELNVPKALTCLSKVRIATVSCGSNHTVATSACGGLWTCGRGRNGQLGHGQLHDEGPMKKVEALGHLEVTQAAAGGTHTLALCANGAAFSWGNDLFGQLGHQTDRFVQEDHALFKSVALPQEITTLRPRSARDPERIVSLSAGSRHSLAVSAGGSLFVWGDNTNGCLGFGDTLKRFTPTRVRFVHDQDRGSHGLRCLHASAGGGHTAALVCNTAKNTTTLLTTGYNVYGQLGHGDRRSRTVFTPVDFFAKRGIQVESVTLGESSSAAITADKSVYLWGRGELGQLGTNDYRSYFVPTLACK